MITREPRSEDHAQDRYTWRGVAISLPAVAAIVLVAALLRFYDLGSQSIWGDEAASWLQSRGTLGQLIIRTAMDNYPPLHNILIWICIRLFGDAEWSLRLPSAVLGTANVFAIYWVGKLFGGRLVGIFAAVLLCLSGFHIGYSQEARMYALLACTATLFAGTSLRLVQTPSIKRMVYAVLAGVGLLYSHVYGALTWSAIAFGFGSLLVVRPTGWKLNLSRFIRVQILIAALFSPWALILVWRAIALSHNGIWIPEPTVDRVLKILSGLSSGTATSFILLGGIVFAFWPRKWLAPGRAAGEGRDPALTGEPRTHSLWILGIFAIGRVRAASPRCLQRSVTCP